MPENQSEPSLIDKIKAALTYPLPHHFLSHLMYKFMRITNPKVKDLQITLITKAFNINLTESKLKAPDEFPDFNSFFTRELREGTRKIEDGKVMLTSPVDGKISQMGNIDGSSIFQAKGHNFTLEKLLGDDINLSRSYINGKFATIYLSPRDYHRIHMPYAGKIKRMIHIPGRLFSVAPYTVNTVPSLFASNERVVCVFDTKFGEMIMVLVGAIFVSSMETVWTGEITPPRAKKVTELEVNRSLHKLDLDKGEEMGRFNMGSTVILLFPKDTVTLNDRLSAGSTLRLGNGIGRVVGTQFT
ncbi:MAG: phosphatidylserine decarboxylase [Gammaproteobacteria bacterium]|nr:MAG: phosphatidylserine decarboxylase [Gammaproteobacteria bacterium]